MSYDTHYTTTTTTTTTNHQTPSPSSRVTPSL